MEVNISIVIFEWPECITYFWATFTKKEKPLQKKVMFPKWKIPIIFFYFLKPSLKDRYIPDMFLFSQIDWTISLYVLVCFSNLILQILFLGSTHYPRLYHPGWSVSPHIESSHQEQWTRVKNLVTKLDSEGHTLLQCVVLFSNMSHIQHPGLSASDKHKVS